MKKVYLDNAATTQLRDEVIKCMNEALKSEYGNPSSTHSFGRSSKSILENCRKEIASILNVHASEIIFTSGGTEADNLALFCSVKDLGITRIISSKIEHHAVLHCLDELEKQFNIEVDYVDLLPNGHINLKHLESLLAKNQGNTLVSLMHVNNEIGNILPLKEVSELCEAHNALFHSDMVQSIGHLPLDLSKVSVNFAAAAAHKFHGPKGVGFAFVRKNSGIGSYIHGGVQERGLRAGTEAVYAIVGMTEALKISYQKLEEERTFIQGLKDYFIESATSKLPGLTFNGDCLNAESSTYTLVNLNLPVTKEQAMMLLFQLDLKGIACSQGSACQSGSIGGSHVIKTLCDSSELKHPALRFSFSSFNTKEDIDYAIGVLEEFIVS